MNASAYTVGRDVVFREGRYAPETKSGKALLAHELTHVAQQRRGGEAVVQRAPDEDPDEIQSYVFAGDKRLSTDKEFARRSGREIAVRMQKAGTLTRELRLELNGMLAFFQGEAKEMYIGEIRPTLVQVSQAAPAPRPRDPTTMFDNIFRNPNYIDNNIKEVSFYGAEVAVIRYNDGATLKLGLVPRWIEPPFEEVDYHTPPGDYRRFTDAKGAFGFFREAELQALPRGVTWGDIQEIWLSLVDFVVEPESGRIVPTVVNTLTAPELCKVLRDSEAQFVNLTQQVAWMGEKVSGIIGWWGGGSWAKGVGGGLARGAATRAATGLFQSRAARQLAGQFDELLRVGGTKTIAAEGVEFASVQVARQGRTLAVSRYSTFRRAAPAGRGRAMSAAFEDAAVATARMNGLKTVTIDVGFITNPGWRVYLESRGYVRTMVQTADGYVNSWVKTIKL